MYVYYDSEVCFSKREIILDKVIVPGIKILQDIKIVEKLSQYQASGIHF